MKNLFLILGLSLVILSSCKKSDDSPSYSQDKLNGTWENIVKTDKGCAEQLIITSTSLKEKTICSSTTTPSISPFETYSFDGKKITVTQFSIPVEYTINELTDTKLVVTISAIGQSEKAEYVKK